MLKRLTFMSLADIITNYNLTNNNISFINELKNFRFQINNLGFKVIRDPLDSNDPVNSVIKNLREIPTINDKEILYNDEFVKYFYEIFWDLIQKLGIATQNFYIFIDIIVFELNRITTPNYIIADCHSTDYYNCGRAMTIINKYLSKLLLFNTDEKGYMDANTQILYLDRCMINAEKPISIEEVKKYFFKYGNRIIKEILLLSKDFTVKLFINNQLTIRLTNKENNNIKISFILPLDYPNVSPSGTFNDLTISDVDLNWSNRESLLNVVHRLMYKYNNKKFPKHIKFLCYLLLF